MYLLLLIIIRLAVSRVKWAEVAERFVTINGTERMWDVAVSGRRSS